MEESDEGCHCDSRERGGFVERHGAGNGRNQVGRHDGVLLDAASIGRAGVGLREDMVLKLPGGHIWSDIFYHASNIVAGDVGKLVGSDDDPVVADFLVMWVYYSEHSASQLGTWEQPKHYC